MPLTAAQLAQLKADDAALTADLAQLTEFVTNPANKARVATAVTAAGKVSADIAGLVADPPALSVTTTSLPSGTVGVAYSAQLAATGGTAPYTWSSAGLPAGLSLSASGAITGTPTAAGSTPVSVKVTDSSTPQLSASAQLNVVIAVAVPPPPPPPNGLDWQPGTTTGSALGFPVNGGQAPARQVQVKSSNKCNFFDTTTVTLELGKTGATEWECTDWNGTVLSTGPVSGESVTVTPGKLGAFRLRLLGPTIDPDYGNAYGACNFSVVTNDVDFPPIPAYAGNSATIPNDPPSVLLSGKSAFGTGSGAGEDLALRAISDCGPIRLSFPAVQNRNTNPQTDGSNADYLSLWTACAQGYMADLAADDTGGWNAILADLARPPRQHYASFINFDGTPGNIAAVTAAVQVMGTAVAYEGYNEPNNTMSASQYFTLHQAFYAAVKAGNPNAQVIGPCTVTINDPSIAWLGEFLALKPNLDGISYHPYNCWAGDAWLGDKCTAALDAVLTQYGYENLPRWCTENGGDFMADYGPGFMRRQMVHSIQRSIQQDAGGTPFERQGYFYANSHGFWGQPSWLVNAQVGFGGGQDANPIVAAMRTRSQNTRGKVCASTQPLGAATDFMRAYLYRNTAGTENTLILFATGSTDLNVKLSSNPDLAVVDLYGNVMAPNSDGTWTVGETPCYASSATAITVLDIDYGLMTARDIAPTGTAFVGAGISTAGVAQINAGVEASAYWSNADEVTSGGPYMDSNNVLPAEAGVTFASPVTVARVAPMAAPPWHQQTAMTDFEIEAEVGGVWQVVETYQDPTATSVPFCDYGTGCARETAYRCEWNRPFLLATPVQATGVRVNITETTWGDAPDVATATLTAGAQGCPQRTVLRGLRVYSS
jgi:hypothetical protein